MTKTAPDTPPTPHARPRNLAARLWAVLPWAHMGLPQLARRIRHEATTTMAGSCEAWGCARQDESIWRVLRFSASMFFALGQLAEAACRAAALSGLVYFAFTLRNGWRSILTSFGMRRPKNVSTSLITSCVGQEFTGNMYSWRRPGGYSWPPLRGVSWLQSWERKLEAVRHYWFRVTCLAASGISSCAGRSRRAWGLREPGPPIASVLS